MDTGMRVHSLGEELSALHLRIREQFPPIDRVGVALYNPKTDVLKTLVHGAAEQGSLARGEILLSSTPSLRALSESRSARVLTGLSFLGSPARAAQTIPDAASFSTFTKPLFSGGHLAGFLFFNSGVPGFLDGPVLNRLEVFADLLALLFLSGLEPMRRLRSAVHLAVQLVSFHDAETGMHLERVSRYAHLIARALPRTEDLDAEFIDSLLSLGPAHDLGKVAIPDQILLKQGALSPSEIEIMRNHVMSGVDVAEALIRELGLGDFPRVSMLRAVVRSHHEAMDGSGYPDGLRGGEIPLEARIVTVADVFDALTSDRPYKQTWTPTEAIGFLVERKGTRFDAACVAALEGCAAEAASIRQQYDAARRDPERELIPLHSVRPPDATTD